MDCYPVLSGILVGVQQLKTELCHRQTKQISLTYLEPSHYQSWPNTFAVTVKNNVCLCLSGSVKVAEFLYKIHDDNKAT